MENKTRNESVRTTSFAARENDDRSAVLAKIEDLSLSIALDRGLSGRVKALLTRRLPLVANAVRRGGARWKPRVARQLLLLSLATWLAGLNPVESNTVSRLRALELEVSGPLELPKKNADT